MSFSVSKTQKYHKKPHVTVKRTSKLHIQNASVIGSFHTLRCYAIKYPLQAKSVCTNSRAKKTILLVWTLSATLAAPVLHVQVGMEN
jgi:hypothetical protein